MNERLTIQEIAGFCPEEAVWKMLADVSNFLSKEDAGYQLGADTIVVVGDQFMVTGEKTHTTKEEMVWALGATAYFAATGHVVFGGHGFSYQQEHPHVALPMLPKMFQSLTSVIHRCLCYNPSDRMSMELLRLSAEKGLAACSQRHRLKAKPVAEPTTEKQYCQVEKWPEEMIAV